MNSKSTVYFLTAAMVVVGFAFPQQSKAESLKEAAAKIILDRGCVACHFIPGIPEAVGTMGPSLKNLMSREMIVNGKLENTPDGLREWLRNPKSISPSTMMPNLGLEESEIEVLIKYFKTI